MVSKKPDGEASFLMYTDWMKTEFPEDSRLEPDVTSDVPRIDFHCGRQCKEEAIDLS